jgi:hypothetical protein
VLLPHFGLDAGDAGLLARLAHQHAFGNAGDRGIAIREEAEAQLLVHFPEPVGTGGGKVLEAFLPLAHRAAADRGEAAEQGVESGDRLADLVVGLDVELVGLGILRVAVRRGEVAVDGQQRVQHAAADHRHRHAGDDQGEQQHQPADAQYIGAQVFGDHRGIQPRDHGEGQAADRRWPEHLIAVGAGGEAAPGRVIAPCKAASDVGCGTERPQVGTAALARQLGAILRVDRQPLDVDRFEGVPGLLCHFRGTVVLVPRERCLGGQQHLHLEVIAQPALAVEVGGQQEGRFHRQDAQADEQRDPPAEPAGQQFARLRQREQPRGHLRALVANFLERNFTREGFSLG